MNYPGGKGGVYQHIINLMPPHETYIETHLGGGAVFRYKRSAKINIGIEIDPAVIKKWSKTSSKEITIIHGDCIKFLKSSQFTGDELIYCDPPYLRHTRKKHYPLYKYEYTIEQHTELLKIIKTLPCMVIISGYESKLYQSYLQSWHFHTFQAKTQHGTATEYLWMNYEPPIELHDYRYLGNNFREREIVSKKIKRWTIKFKSMPVLERQALLSSFQNVHTQAMKESTYHA